MPELPMSIHFRAFPLWRNGLKTGWMKKQASESAPMIKPAHAGSMPSFWRYCWNWKKAAVVQAAMKKIPLSIINSFEIRVAGLAVVLFILTPYSFYTEKKCLTPTRII